MTVSNTSPQKSGSCVPRTDRSFIDQYLSKCVKRAATHGTSHYALKVWNDLRKTPEDNPAFLIEGIFAVTSSLIPVRENSFTYGRVSFSTKDIVASASFDAFPFIGCFLLTVNTIDRVLSPEK